MTQPVPAAMLVLSVQAPIAAAATPEGADILWSPAMRLVLRERVDQVERHGYSPQHDDGHGNGDIGRGAIAYALAALAYANDDDAELFVQAERNWPWDQAGFHPSDEVLCHIKAAAMHIAEADRVIRAKALLEYAR